jgi:hypothetical protein
LFVGAQSFATIVHLGRLPEDRHGAKAPGEESARRGRICGSR